MSQYTNILKTDEDCEGIMLSLQLVWDERERNRGEASGHKHIIYIVRILHDN